MKRSEKAASRSRRKRRIRGKVRGTAARPRLGVFRSCKHLYVQFIDDEAGKTLGQFSTLSPRFRERHPGPSGNLKAAAVLGELAGMLARELKISEVVFDRGGYKYHGRVKALAEAVRAAGIKF